MLADALSACVDKVAWVLAVEALVEAEQRGGVEEGMHLCGVAAVRKAKSKRKRHPDARDGTRERRISGTAV